MQKLTSAVKDTAKQLLAEKKVDLVVGYAQGSLPLRSTPSFARTEAEADKLIFDATCENNLANFVRKRNEKIAVIAKGCDVRAILALVKEGQIVRENLTIIGVPCEGVIDRKKVSAAVAGKEILAANLDGDNLIISGKGFEKTLPATEVLFETCKSCAYGTPVVYNQLLGEAVAAKETSYSEVEAFEQLSETERRSFIAQEMSKCIRCYACRQACPMCYCTECFVDCNTPAWIGKSAESVNDNALFQAVRVFHLAGRCADCGACERACPMGIKLSFLTRKMVKDVKELFGAEAGINETDPPALNTFTMEDPQPFLVKE